MTKNSYITVWFGRHPGKRFTSLPFHTSLKWCNKNDEMKSREIWKDIPGYAGLYQVSTLGRFKSLDRVITYKNGYIRKFKGRVLKPINHSTGYITVNIYKNKKIKTFRAHKLVALVFIPNPENKPCINHKNGDKHDNRVYNIEWCTSLENMRHAIKNGYVNNRGSNSKTAKLTETNVIDIRERIKNGQSHSSIGELYGVRQTTITAINTGQNWSHLKN